MTITEFMGVAEKALEQYGDLDMEIELITPNAFNFYKTDLYSDVRIDSDGKRRLVLGFESDDVMLY